MRIPETEEPVTRGRVVVDRGQGTNEPASALHAFSQGAIFGLVVAGQILYEPKTLCYSNYYVANELFPVLMCLPFCLSLLQPTVSSLG
jgi:hypothetical protein